MTMLVSPTPASSGGRYYETLARRSATRRPLSTASIPAPLSRVGYKNDGDSSDEENEAPPLSIEAEEILGVKTAERHGAGLGYVTGSTRTATNTRSDGLGRTTSTRTTATSVSHRSDESGSPIQRSGLRSSRVEGGKVVKNSPTRLNGTTPRVVRVSRQSPAGSGLRRAASTSSVQDGSPLASRTAADVKTPAPRVRSALASSGVSSNGPVESAKYVSGGSAASSGKHMSGGSVNSAAYKSTAEEDPARDIAASGHQSKKSEDVGAYSLRVKRLGKVQGRFLSGPARRGVIRRQSEEEPSPSRQAPPSPVGYDENEAQPERPVEEERKPLGSVDRRSSGIPHHVRFSSRDAAAADPNRAFEASPLKPAKTSPSPKPTRLESPIQVRRSPAQLQKSPVQAKPIISPLSKSLAPKEPAPNFKVPPPPLLPSAKDQENDPPPTFRRDRKGSDLLVAQKLMSAAEDIKNPLIGQTPATASPVRKALAPRSHNTPMRPAPPPPPKMSALETATATAGAAASAHQQKKKRNYISVNGKLFTRMECIGRGGSGRVYRVMAENYKLFALKRVSLEDVDEAAIRGFKGEIDLLRKLESVDRVVRLWDFEINEERKTLSVLMDIGEADLKRILDPRLDVEQGGKFDPTFTRYIWKEMLECVAAVHEYDVVHSDLKPANFVLMQGRLKLIDFGIANAIQDDTVNVHREQQIGTPNYMAPEALLDTNAMAAAHARQAAPTPNKRHQKLMKLGKPSDVWSLGCILYQIVYGRPPFGHIPNQMSKVLAITDRHHAVDFPALGLGGVPVPAGLLRTLKACLQRDPAARPTTAQLLGPADPFLHPEAAAVVPSAAAGGAALPAGTVPASQELIKRLQANVLRIIEVHGMPGAREEDREAGRERDEADKEWLDRWAPQLWGSMKSSVERGTA